MSVTVTKSQLSALLSAVVNPLTFTVGEFDSLPMGIGTLLVLNLQDGVPCLKDKRFLTVWVDRKSSYGGTAVEAGFGPIPFDNSEESFRWAIEFGLQQLATGQESPGDADEEVEEGYEEN